MLNFLGVMLLAVLSGCGVGEDQTPSLAQAPQASETALSSTAMVSGCGHCRLAECGNNCGQWIQRVCYQLGIDSHCCQCVFDGCICQGH
jgi:hypothetical protein